MKFSFIFLVSLFPASFAMAHSNFPVPNLSFLTEFRVQGLWETCTQIERYTYLLMRLAHLPVASTFSRQLICEIEFWERRNMNTPLLLLDGRLHFYLTTWFEDICTAVDIETNHGFALDQQVWDAWSTYQQYMYRLLPPSLD